MSDLVIADKSEIVSIADSVRQLTGTTNTMTLSQMKSNLNTTKTSIDNAFTALSEKGIVVPDGSVAGALENLISSIETGSGGGATSSKDVNFYDYDGTLLYAYTIDEAQALTALPDGPSHPGLVFYGWNWTLEKVQSLTRPMNIGTMYSTDDGTTRIYIHLEDGRTSPMLGVCPNGTVTVDWGDGTNPDVLTGTSLTTVQWTPTHDYTVSGDYVIRLTVDGEAQLLGSISSNAYSYILRYSSSADSRNIVYLNAIKKVEVGNGVSIGDAAFYYCSSLSGITIPYGITSIGTFAFSNCRSLSSIIIPDGTISIKKNAFQFCSLLSNIILPDSITSIGKNAFDSCSSLSSITIPDSITSIGTYAFNSCYSLSIITIPGDVTIISDYMFSSCYSLYSIVIPDSATSIGKFAFNSCYSLSSIVIPNSATSIGSNSFQSCYGMKYYDFTRHTTVPTLSDTKVFNNIVADCEIRVPAVLVDEWKAATNWATYADYIVGV